MQRFAAILQIESDLARFYLDASSYNLQSAINLFLDNPPQNLVNDAREHLAYAATLTDVALREDNSSSITSTNSVQNPLIGFVGMPEGKIGDNIAGQETKRTLFGVPITNENQSLVQAAMMRGELISTEALQMAFSAEEFNWLMKHLVHRDGRWLPGADLNPNRDIFHTSSEATLMGSERCTDASNNKSSQLNYGSPPTIITNHTVMGKQHFTSNASVHSGNAILLQNNAPRQEFTSLHSNVSTSSSVPGGHAHVNYGMQGEHIHYGGGLGSSSYNSGTDYSFQYNPDGHLYMKNSEEADFTNMSE